MDCLFRCCAVYDTRASLFTRHTLLVSHLPSISLHSIALKTRDFLFASVRNPPTVLVSSKFSWRISCEAISTNQSHLNPQILEIQRRHNAMKHFLLEECCFSSSEITLLMNKDPSIFRRKSTDRARQVLQMLTDCGFTIKQIKRAILRNTSILTRLADYLRPRIEYFKTLGIAEEDLNSIISRNPRILTVRLDETFDRRILSLLKFFGSKDNLFEALRKAPGIASCDVDLLNAKLKILENAGLLEREIKEFLEKNPQFLCFSVGKIEKNMKFLTCTMGLKPSAVVKCPFILNYSVDKRIRPRYKVFQYLKLHAPHDLPTSFFTTLSISEVDFTERFLSSSPKVKMLYDKYKGKTVDVEIPAHQNFYLRPRIEYFKTLGIAEEELNYIISLNPRILNVRLDETLDQRILSLLKFFGSKDNLFEALRKAPGIASCDVDLLNTKLKILENAGLLEHEIKELLEKNPQFLCFSVGKIEKNMKFLTCTMGLKPSAVVKYPFSLNYSVDKRIRPRYKVFQYLKLHAPHDLTTSLFTTLIISEVDFTERFLSSSPRVKMLYDKYKGKTVDVEIPELLPAHQI